MQAHGRQYRPVGPAKFAIRDPMHRVGVAIPPFISRPAYSKACLRRRLISTGSPAGQEEDDLAT